MILKTGDEFTVWTRPEGDPAGPYRAARVLVGPEGGEPLRLGVPAPCRDFAEPLLWVLSPAGAQALLDRTRAGGDAGDDAP